MLRDSAVDLLMGRLGKRVSSVTQQDIINEMAFVQENILEGDATPYWFLLSEESDAITTADDERVELPPDFIQEWEDGALYYVDDDGVQKAFIREDYDVLKGSSSLEGTGKPKYYDIAGDYILLRQIPDDIYTIYMRYYQRQADLSGTYGDAANVENGWLKHASDLFIAEVGVIIANQYLQSDKMVQMFMKQADTARLRLVKKDTAWRESNKQRSMGA